MKLSLINFESDEEFILDAENPVIIGRGSLLGCHDKRVSRNHGQIQLTPDGNVHLTALHTNPCFFMKNGETQINKLTKEEGKTLCNDDYVGLLWDSFWYKIIICNDETDKDSNNELDVHDDCENDTVIKPANVCEKPTGQISEDEIVNSALNYNNETLNLGNTKKLVSTSSKQDETVTSNSLVTNKLKLLENTKRLPLSMYEIDDFPEEIDKGKKEMESSELFNETGVQFEENQDSLETDSTTGTNSKDTSQPQREVSMTDEEEHAECLITNKVDKNPDSECEKENASHSSKVRTDNIHGHTSNDNDISSGTTCKKRPICQYEDKCYRKNFQHKKDFCHPGDSDFVPYESRPVCQYGLSCYRKDRGHKIEYQHVKRNVQKNPKKTPPDNSKKKKEKMMKTCADTSEEEDYDLEDPFLDDGSSDDYVPTNTDSEEDSQGFYSNSKRSKLDKRIED